MACRRGINLRTFAAVDPVLCQPLLKRSVFQNGLRRSPDSRFQFNGKIVKIDFAALFVAGDIEVNHQFFDFIAVDRFRERTKFQSHALVFLRKPDCFLELRVIEELERFLPLQHDLKPQSGVIAFGIKADLVILIRLVSESLNDADRFAGNHFDSEALPAVRRVARIDSCGGGVIDPIASRPLFKRRVDESGSAIERNTGKYGKTR